MHRPDLRASSRPISVVIGQGMGGAGYTMANGTGACAAAGVAYKLGLTGNKVIVHMPGGELQVEIEDDWTVYMTGDVFYVAKITLSNRSTHR